MSQIKEIQRPTRSPASRLMAEVRELLDCGSVSAALELLGQSNQSGRAAANAKGVCFMRMGDFRRALPVFRELVYPAGAFTVPEGTPVAFQVNFITVLFHLDQVLVGRTLLREISRSSHPGIGPLKEAERKWKRSLSWWRRLLLVIGAYPSKPVSLDFPPGVLWDPAEEPAAVNE